MILYSEYNYETGLIVSELIEYNQENSERSKKKLEKLKKDNIFMSEFNDTHWILNNEYEKINLNFNFDEVKYKKEFKNRQMYTFNQFVDSVKAYVVFTINKKALSTLSSCLYGLKNYINTTNYFNKKKSNKIDINSLDMQSLRFIEGYLNFVQFDGTEYYTDLLEEQSPYVLTQKNDRNSKRRSLSDFQSIFLFNNIIEDFWQNDNSLEKNKYLPLYIWWRITNIIPLRLKEFCITPYDCIEVVKDNKYYIKLRRSKLKGRKNTDVTHKIDEDYILKKYVVTKEIADLILCYKKMTESHRKDNKLLLCYQTHRFYTEQTLNTDEFINNGFRRETLSQLLKRFFVEIIQNKYGYNIVTYKDFISTLDSKSNVIELEFKPLEKKEITMFRVGDIRHFALINMVLNDINPILVKELVNHEDINTTFHYFGNIDELVKCMSYIKYKELYDNQVNKNKVVANFKFNISSNKIFNELNPIKSVEVDNGECISQYFISGKLDDCIVVDGDCENCDFIIREKSLSKEEIKTRVKISELETRRNAELLEELLKSYKNNFIINKQIDKASLKLQNSIELYQSELIKNGDIIWEK